MKYYTIIKNYIYYFNIVSEAFYYNWKIRLQNV